MKTLRHISLVLHRYVGLYLGAVIVALSLSGSILVFHGEIDAWLHPDVLRVEPVAERVPVDRVAERVEAAFPDDGVRFIRFPQSPSEPYKVWLTQRTHERVFVDPADGSVLGHWDERETLTGWLFGLHTDLFAGTVGAWVVGLSGLALVLLCLSGLVLWWPGVRNWWMAVTVKAKRLNYDLHRAGGFWTLLFVLVIALTGAGLIFYTSAGHLLHWVTGTTLTSAAPPTAAPSGAGHVSLASAFQVAQDELPGATPTFLYVPQSEQAPVLVRFRMAGELHPNGRSYAYVDPYRGSVLRVDRAVEGPLGQRLQHALYPLHIGSFGGGAVKVVYALLGVVPAALAVTGVIIWYPRWRRKKQQLGRRRSRRRARGNQVADQETAVRIGRDTVPSDP